MKILWQSFSKSNFLESFSTSFVFFCLLPNSFRLLICLGSLIGFGFRFFLRWCLKLFCATHCGPGVRDAYPIIHPDSQTLYPSSGLAFHTLITQEREIGETQALSLPFSNLEDHWGGGAYWELYLNLGASDNLTLMPPSGKQGHLKKSHKVLGLEETLCHTAHASSHRWWHWKPGDV